MNALGHPSFQPNGRTDRDRDVDRLLCAYFQAEMPSAWPDIPRDTRVSPADERNKRRWTISGRNRFVLAASLLLLLVGQLALSNLFSDLQLTRSDRESGQIEATRRRVKAILKHDQSDGARTQPRDTKSTRN
jgi:hypothetical protein